MFRFALLSCFLVSMDYANCMHIFAVNPSNQEVKNEGPITNIKLNEIDESEISSITFSCEISTDEKRDGFVSKSSSSAMTSNTFTNLQELETICNTIKKRLADITDANAKIELDIRTSLDKNEVSAILAKCFNSANIQIGKVIPKTVGNRNECLPFALKKSESEPEQQACPEIRSNDEPCGLFATRVDKKVAQNQVRNSSNDWQQNYKIKQAKRPLQYEIRWAISTPDQNTVILGKILERVWNSMGGSRVSCEVKPGMFTINTNDSQQVFEVIRYIKYQGGLQNVLDQEQIQQEFGNLDFDAIVQQFDEIFSEPYTEIVQRNTRKYGKWRKRSDRKHFNRLWF